MARPNAVADNLLSLVGHTPMVQLNGITEAAAAKRWQRLRTKLRESAVWDTMLKTLVAEDESSRSPGR